MKSTLVLAVCLCTLASLLSSIQEVEAEQKRQKKANSYLLRKPQCTEKRQKHLESEMAKSLPIGGQSSKKFPETIAEVQVYCR